MSCELRTWPEGPRCGRPGLRTGGPWSRGLLPPPPPYAPGCIHLESLDRVPRRGLELCYGRDVHVYGSCLTPRLTSCYMQGSAFSCLYKESLLDDIMAGNASGVVPRFEVSVVSCLFPPWSLLVAPMLGAVVALGFEQTPRPLSLIRRTSLRGWSLPR